MSTVLLVKDSEAVMSCGKTDADVAPDSTEDKSDGFAEREECMCACRLTKITASSSSSAPFSGVVLGEFDQR